MKIMFYCSFTRDLKRKEVYIPENRELYQLKSVSQAKQRYSPISKQALSCWRPCIEVSLMTTAETLWSGTTSVPRVFCSDNGKILSSEKP